MDSAAFAVLDELNLLWNDDQSRVVIDSGSTHCITPKVKALTGFKPESVILQLAAKGQQISAAGIGILALRLHNQSGHYDVEIPNAIGLEIARHTLVGTKTLQKIGIGASFPPFTELCILTDANGMEICRGQSVGIGLYEMPILILYPKVEKQMASMLSAESNSVVHYGLGHLRLAHINK